MANKLIFDDLPDPEDRFALEDCLGAGVCGKVYRATDSTNGRKVAIKVQKINRETTPYIQEEYRVLKEFSSHPNLVDFYGVFRKVQENDDEVWFVLELCEGGSVSSLVNALMKKNRRMREEHIAFILKEIIKAVVYLHENRVIHRDIKASNILLTKDGEVKLIDFGISRHLSSTFGKSDSCIGSPCWMAPEVVVSTVHEDDESGYGNRADVWSVGITAVEMADGRAPFQDMHPTRAMFQIVRNPPPSLYRPANWSDRLNDFVAECLEKNPEHRPYAVEIMEHPFLEDVPENNYHLCQELKVLQDFVDPEDAHASSSPGESLVSNNFMKTSIEGKLEKMYVEDLAALDRVNEDAILQELSMRMKQGYFQTFVGDVLLILNPNEEQNIYGPEHHKKYCLKSRSDNAPHIFAIADGAYQDALHHLLPQYVVLAGESGSGKTTNFLHLIDHFLYLAKNDNINSARIRDAADLIQAFTNAATPLNDNSTRCVMKTELSFGSTGKVTGAAFTIYQVEKWRISSVDMIQSNFNILYYFYEGLKSKNELEKYNLNNIENFRYLRLNDKSSKKLENAAEKYEKLLKVFKVYEFDDDQLNAVHKIISSILLIGEIRFKEAGENKQASIENEDIVERVSQLLEIDHKKLSWSLTNYCLIKKGSAVKRSHNANEARDARDVLANMLYTRLLDYVVNFINHKLEYGKQIFGDKYSIRILDMYGFEGFKENHLPQLFANTFNEQLHYHYLQRVFAWEALEMNEEDIPYGSIHYYDNKLTLDQILSKPEGVLPLIDAASRMGHGGDYVIDYLKNPERENVRVLGAKEFTVSHFTGKITYNVKEMPDRNRDFLPPDVIEVLRTSGNKIIKSLFANKLTKTGNLSMNFDDEIKPKTGSSSDEDVLSKANEQQFSQINKMRTAVSTFRSLCLDILKELSVGGGAGGTHFVRCIRSDLDGKPRGFHSEIVKQQLRALSIVDTAKARQKGYSYRVSFSEFLRRYKFLAFDFEENVDVTKENCRLLLIRLKMEGWIIGKSKVFMKYYNEEYLARLYETQVKKIIKIQCVMRGFLTKIKMRKGWKKTKSVAPTMTAEDAEEDKAARVLQKAYRGVASRKACGPLLNEFERMDAGTCKFIRFYCARWRAKSIFQVLLQYRAARYQDLFNFTQQVHLFNQMAANNVQTFNNSIGLHLIDKHAQANAWLGEAKPSVLKIPFRLDEIPFFDTSYMCDPILNPSHAADEEEEDWDAPYQWRNTVSSQITSSLNKDSQETPEAKFNKPYTSHITTHRPSVACLRNLPYSRDPDQPIRRLSTAITDQENVPQAAPRNISRGSSVESYKEKIDSMNKKAKNINVTVKPYKPQPSNGLDNNPISELKKLGRQDSGNDDDAPFNFQAMLRKTNNRESLKRSVDAMARMSLKKRDGDNQFGFKGFRNERGEKLDNGTEKLQLAPGIYIEGVVADL